MNIKRIAGFSLAALISLQLLVSCGSPASDGGSGDSGNNAATDNVAEVVGETLEEATEISDDIPELDFEGYEFTILNYRQADLHYMNLLMEATEETGDVINDAAYRRSAEIAERFNVTFTEVNNTGVTSVFQKAVLSGDNTYDLAMVSAGDAFNMAAKDMIYNINDLPYINLNKPWWDQNARESFSIANKIFFQPGAYELSNIDMTRIILFNKKLMKDYGISENVYELVLNGEWTYEKFFSMAKAVSQDVDGNGVFDYQDVFGAGSTADHVVFGAFLDGTGELTVKKDSNDIPYFAAGGERFTQVVQTMVENFYDGNFYFYPKNGPNAEEWCTNMFDQDRMLFYIITFNRIPKFRAMNADFGILPLPKFDTAQDNYYCESGSGMVGVVPQSIDNPERTGAIWEAYCAGSYKYVIPAYKEVSLKTKFARDDESSAMVDIIYDGRVYDLGKIYWGSRIFDPYVTLLSNKSTDVASVTDKYKTAADKAIADGIEVFTD